MAMEEKEVNDKKQNLAAVITQHCETAEEFLDRLSPRGEIFRDYDSRWWLFRGHSDDAYELTPSARRNHSNDLRALVPGGPILFNEDQVFAELLVLSRFFEVADSIGLQLPEDSQIFRRLIEKDITNLPRIWPPIEILSVIAVAQHHGLPTCLLDWSRHRLKAAYFAAAEAALRESESQPSCSGRLSVWALMLASTIYPIETLDGEPGPITIVTAPGSTNANLRAQEGVFTLTRPILPDRNPVDRRSLETILAEDSTFYCPSASDSDSWCYRITLPVSESAKLLWELSRERVTAANLFPDFYGVVTSLKDARRWPDLG
jgi:hypothetical protein